MNPAPNPRGRARNASKTPCSRVNAVKNPHLDVQEIIKDCPALDVLLGNDIRRNSTHNRARDKGHVRRPPNAFMIYRSYAWHTKQLEDNEEKNLSRISKQLGHSWEAMGEQARRPFLQVAVIASREHRARNPDYKYAPRSQKSPKKPARRASRAKVKAEVKESATHRNARLDSLPLLKQATPTPACTPRSPSELFGSSSSPTPTPPSTPPTPMPRQWALNLPPSSPELRYLYDCDRKDYPPQPRVRPVTSGLIPSPSMSVLQLNDAHTPSILDEVPDVSPKQLQYLSDVANTDHHSL